MLIRTPVLCALQDYPFFLPVQFPQIMTRNIGIGHAASVMLASRKMSSRRCGHRPAILPKGSCDRAPRTRASDHRGNRAEDLMSCGGNLDRTLERPQNPRA